MVLVLIHFKQDFPKVNLQVYYLSKTMPRLSRAFTEDLCPSINGQECVSLLACAY